MQSKGMIARRMSALRPLRARRPGMTTIALGEAAQILGVSASTVRRWADGGKLRVARTDGGHRRFARADVERLQDFPTIAPRLRYTAPLGGPAPATADVISSTGVTTAAAAARSIYEPGATGWLGSPDSLAPLERWVDELAAACRAGDEKGIGIAVERLVTDARAAGTRLTEIDTFFSQYVGEIYRRAADRQITETDGAASRWLFINLRRHLLHLADAL